MGNDRSEQGEIKELALRNMEVLVSVARESFLILDSEMRVLMANPTFYKTFQVTPEQTESRLLYELGDGQWRIPELERLMEEILPEKKAVRDYSVTHRFQTIGERTMLLNARQIDSVQLVILAIEDITSRKKLEDKLVEYTKELEKKVSERTAELAEQVTRLELTNKTMVGRELKMVELKKEIKKLKERAKNGNGSNGLAKRGGNRNGNHRNSNHKNGNHTLH